MNDFPTIPQRSRLASAPKLLTLGLCCLLLDGARAVAQDPKPAGDTGKVVGQCVKVEGALLARTKPGTAWKSVKAKDDVVSGTLLVAIPGAEIEAKNKAVRLVMAADVAQRSKDPVFESGVVLHDAADVDLDVTLDRGRMGLINDKKQGAAHVRLHVAGQTLDLILKEPGTKVGMQLHGRHAPGLREHVHDPKGYKSEIDPTLNLGVIVFEGHAELDVGPKSFALQAPPGPALFFWDNVVGAESGPVMLKELPEELKPLNEAEKKRAESIIAWGTQFADQPPDVVLTKNLNSDDAADRRRAVIVLAALDDLPGLLGALGNKDQAEVRQTAIIALRHWLGRTRGQDETLYRYLTEEKKLTPVQAKGFLQLLFGFNTEDQAKPEIYEVLIRLLRHEQLPIRELAAFHLYRLVPAGKDIAYNAAGSAEELKEAQEKWKKLIPEGQLPPKPKEKPPEK